LLEILVCPLCKGPLQHRRPQADPAPEPAGGGAPAAATAPGAGATAAEGGAAAPQPELVCRADRLAFPVRDGIPVMLVDEARKLDDVD
jgi:uncharacterized protein YbaR (Trm112 family)